STSTVGNWPAHHLVCMRAQHHPQALPLAKGPMKPPLNPEYTATLALCCKFRLQPLVPQHPQENIENNQPAPPPAAGPSEVRRTESRRGQGTARRLRGGPPEVTPRRRRGRGMAEEASGRPPEETLSLWKREQARLKARVVARDTEAWQRDPAFAGLRRVGGVDVSFVKGDSARACASLVVLSFPELEVVYEDCRMVSLTAPYVSGFLAFREVPFLVDAVQRLREKAPQLVPQVLLVDGNGVLHHRGFGVACHLGILTDLPCVGVAKKLLQVDGLENNALHKERVGRPVARARGLWAGGGPAGRCPVGSLVLCHLFTRPPPGPWPPFARAQGGSCRLREVVSCPGLSFEPELAWRPKAVPLQIRGLQAGGDTFELTNASGAVLGMALRSHDHSTKPLYVSVGHKMSLEAAVRLTHGCCRFRIPEPVRQVGGPPGAGQAVKCKCLP
ncbi:Endonuclease V, partial [Galemys pyrenaicus]